jgi:hypothetical protein
VRAAIQGKKRSTQAWTETRAPDRQGGCGGFAGRFRKLRVIVGLVMLAAVKGDMLERRSTPALATRADEAGRDDGRAMQ